MAPISHEMARSTRSEHDKQDELAREALRISARPIENRIDVEYQQHIQDLLEDLQQGYEVEQVNAFESEEYCVILKSKDTGEVKAYGFEMPLNIILSPKDGHNEIERAGELTNYLTKIVTSKK